MKINLILWLERAEKSHLWFLAVLISILLTEAIVSIMGVLLKNEVTADYLLTGLITSAFVATFVVSMMGCFLERLSFVQEDNDYLNSIIIKLNLIDQILRDASEAYHCILATTLDGFLVVSPQGKLLDVNYRYTKQSGHSREELLNMHIMDLDAIESTGGNGTHIQHIIEKGVDQFESLLRRKDGTFWHVEVSTSYCNFRGGVFYVFLRDISKRKKTEAEREQFFKFFNFAPGLQCIVSLDGFFRQVNPAFTETLGYSKDELLQTPFIEFVVPEDRQKTLDEARKQYQNGKLTMGFENRYLRKNGSFCWLSWRAFFDPTGQIIYAIALDVTESKKNEEKLLFADMVYQNTLEGILVTDANNQIIAVNPAFTEITGYTRDEVIGKNPKIFKSGLHSQDFYQTMWQEIKTKGYWQGEIWDKHKQGELHAKFLNINIIRDKEGQVYRYLALFSDITARKQYEEEIKRLSDSELNKAKLEAERANQAKSDFLASMRHELFTPMNAVLGFAQLLESEDLTEDQLDSVKEILAAGHHLMDLINEVLDLSKIEADKLEITLEKIDLNALLQTCLTLIQPLAVKNEVEIIDNCCCKNSNFYLLGDKLRLKQVLLNLISNAIKYNRMGGRVILSCEKGGNHQTLRIKVIDTGNGLSEAQLSKLFQPFERLSAKNSNIEGTGIGLLITKKLVEAMNGTIEVSSAVGMGSCFWIEIPQA